MRICLRLLVGAVCCAVSFGAMPASASAQDSLARLYAQILKNPANTELNLRYAQLAEASGKPRWALAAYERILINDPNNAEARRGLERIQRGLVPVDTRFTFEAGGAIETNPTYVPNGRQTELQSFASLRVRDERNIGGVRWRTNGTAAGIVHQNVPSLNYGYVGGVTGPVFDFLPGTSIHIGAGGGVSALEQRWYYSEALATATVFTHTDGVFQSLDVRWGYRDYNDAFPSTSGSFVDVRARFAFRDVLNTPALLIATPWARWSDVGGTTTTLLLTEIQPGAYSEWGGRLELVAPVTEGVFMGPTGILFDRYYRTDLVAGTTTHRHDTIFGPGVLVWIPHAVSYQTGLKFEYQYLNDKSNDPARRFVDHLFTGSVVSRF